MATQALILAAGRGSRLGPQTSEVPKPLLQVGSRHLIEYQLGMLADAGIGPVGMVLGYNADDVQEVVGMRAEFMYNGRWATTNSLASFLAAKDWIQGDLLVLNCDILFHPDILTRLLSAGPDSFAFDSSSGDGLEHMKVQLDRDRNLTRMSKTLDSAYAHGENVGILYFKESTVHELVRIGEAQMEKGGEKNWIGAAVQTLCRSVPLRAVDVAGRPWVEIDFAYDLNRARKEVLPAIVAFDRKKWIRRASYVAAAIILAIGIFGITAGRGAGTVIPSAIVEWEGVSIDGGSQVLLDKDGQQQPWWLLQSGDAIEATIEGPADVFVESRLVLDHDSTAGSPYLLEVKLDGDVVDWYRSSAPISQTGRYEGLRVGKRDRELVAVGPGQHTLRLHLSTVLEDRALVRMYQVDTDLD